MIAPQSRINRATLRADLWQRLRPLLTAALWGVNLALALLLTSDALAAIWGR